MADFSQNLRNAWARGMAAVSTTANGLADQARLRADEHARQNQRNDLIRSVGERVYSLYQEGAVFQPEVMQLLHELYALDLQHSLAQQAAQSGYAQQSSAATPSPASMTNEPYTTAPVVQTEEPKPAQKSEEPAVNTAPVVSEQPSAPVYSELEQLVKDLASQKDDVQEAEMPGVGKSPRYGWGIQPTGPVPSIDVKREPVHAAPTMASQPVPVKVQGVPAPTMPLQEPVPEAKPSTMPNEAPHMDFNFDDAYSMADDK